MHKFRSCIFLPSVLLNPGSVDKLFKYIVRCFFCADAILWPLFSCNKLLSFQEPADSNPGMH